MRSEIVLLMKEINVSDKFDYHQQALEAALAEAVNLGVDIHDLERRVIEGIMGNATYTWIPTDDKTNSIKVLKNAVTQVNSYS